MEIDSGPTATGSRDVEVDCEVNSKRIQGGSFEFKGKKESRVQVSDTHKKVDGEQSYGMKARQPFVGLTFRAQVLRGSFIKNYYNGEFDPGSG